MNFGCMSCGAKYSVPDQRLVGAGPGGLRVRCSRCRAIMVVAESSRVHQEEELSSPSEGPAHPSEDEETHKELRARARPSPTDASPEVHAAQDEMSAVTLPPMVGASHVPAALSASGVFRPLPGVHRQVTGLFFPEMHLLPGEEKPSGSRIWYAAIGNRPRGPFSATEMIHLAERGKLRDATLVWRPGFSTWKKIRHGDAGTAEDLTWLRKIVLARKLREIDAQERARDRLGIQPIKLSRTSSGAPRPVWAQAVPGMPPLPAEDPEDGIAPPVAPASSAEAMSPAASLFSNSLGRTDDVIPFAWRADELPRLDPSRQRHVRVRMAAVGLLCALSAVLFAWLVADADVVATLATLLSP